MGVVSAASNSFAKRPRRSFAARLFAAPLFSAQCYAGSVAACLASAACSNDYPPWVPPSMSAPSSSVSAPRPHRPPDAGDASPSNSEDPRDSGVPSEAPMGSVELVANLIIGCGSTVVLVAPLETAVGFAISMTAEAERAETYTWSLKSEKPIGEVVSPHAPTTEFKCKKAGKGTLLLEVAGDECWDHASIPIRCAAKKGD